MDKFTMPGIMGIEYEQHMQPELVRCASCGIKLVRPMQITCSPDCAKKREETTIKQILKLGFRTRRLHIITKFK